MRATDAELVSLTRAGDNAAFGELVRRYQGLMYGLAYHRIGNFADAQDIAQEVFVKAYRHLSQLNEPERFTAWLRTMTTNECKMWLRASRRTVSLEETEALPSHESEPDESWRRRERQAEVRKAVAALPERSRLIVSLHYLSGLSQREIGEFLGMRTNTVSQHLSRARRRLKRILMAEIEEAYAMNKLPDSFTQDALRKATLFPLVEGYFVTSLGEGDIRGLTMRVGERGPEESIITLWMRRDDLDAIAPIEHGAGKVKARAIESALQIMSALGIGIGQVTLRLSDGAQCRADVDLKQGNTEVTIDMRPSDALCLAVRVKAPICVEEAVVRQGNVAEDDVPAPEEQHSSAEWMAELEAHHQVDLLRDQAFEIGLSPEDMVDTIHYHVNEAEGVIRIWLEAAPDRESTVSLKEHEAGVEKLLELARSRSVSGHTRNGRWYRVFYSLLGEDARMRLVPDEGAEAEFGMSSA